MSFNLLSLRTKLSILTLKWTNLPHISNFNQYIDKLDKLDINTLEYPDIDNCRLIGYIIPKYPKYNNNSIHQNSIYILTDMDNYLYLSLGLSHPILWYSIRVFGRKINDSIINEIQDIIDLYDTPDDQNNLSYDSYDYVLLGNINKLKKGINDIELELLKSNTVETLMWGSNYSEYPYDRQVVFNSSGKEKIKYVTNALQQKTNHYIINCRTISSKSHIKIIQYQKFINIQIKYKAVNTSLSIIDDINKTYDKNYPDDLPLDVILTLMDYPYLNHRQVINDHDSMDDIITFLKVMIPSPDRPQFFENIKYYCHDQTKIDYINQNLS